LREAFFAAAMTTFLLTRIGVDERNNAGADR
jgi:hypothetical protein